MKGRERRRFRRDPLEYIENLRHTGENGMIRLPWGGWCVSDADLAQTLLRDPEFNSGTSDFFGALLPTRSAQVEVGHAVRDFLRASVPRYRAALSAVVADLPAAGNWPTAATELVYRCMADLLLDPDGTPARTRRLMHHAVHGGVVFQQPHTWQRAWAEVLRARLITAVTAQVRARRNEHADTPREVHAGAPRDVHGDTPRDVHGDTPRGVDDGAPRDVLDALLSACPPAEVADRTVAELHLMMFRSIVAPVSSSLAWSVLLACLNHTSDSPWPWPADQIVREALRHRPMVWMVGRTLPRSAEFGGIAFQPGQVLSASPYLLHHDPQHWNSPHSFSPGRWAEAGKQGPYIPFGAGPFTCAGVSVAHTMLTETLTALTHDARLTVTGGDTRPVMVEGNVPRPFSVHRAPRNPRPPTTAKGGEQP